MLVGLETFRAPILNNETSETPRQSAEGDFYRSENLKKRLVRDIKGQFRGQFRGRSTELAGAGGEGQ
jgi:hypothetical protein